ncbi:hypothetical protein QDR37_10465 [Amnibacterium sp. CER49]|uniref:hypothetical protein n=1 Tax=Amnibacterium sp. CER49 TaxID=3039161 RepID=UPI002447806B|nr:hypothetical protein [Amnibacterium sp. CER49]MDH2444365.1 hypothetical protein [Amnibacterium sp. CER49]
MNHQISPSTTDCPASQSCPPWCVVPHGTQDGEEDWLHLGAPLQLADGVTARLCMSRDPETGETDGPFVLIAEREHSLEEAAALGADLTAMAGVGAVPAC